MKITIITLFPDMINAFFSESIIKRAQEKGQVEIQIVNLRDFSADNYKTVDDRPYGGGAGMVIKVDVVARALLSLREASPRRGDEAISSYSKNENREIAALQKPSLAMTNNETKEQQNTSKVVLTSARGNIYTQEKAQEYSKLEHLVILAGHYEGFDERVSDFIDEEVSLGDFVMTGGEIPAAAIVDSVVRLLPGVLKKDDATLEESFFIVDVDRLIHLLGEDNVLTDLKNRGITKVRLLEYPQYTRPEKFDGKEVPEILLSGDHKKIEEWQLKEAFNLTKKRRPDLLRISNSS